MLCADCNRRKSNI
ncbi:MAG: hypothetical protein FWF10_10940 [Clostridiales bacterium]|nr:hypothetical protein [Clostridiales bacterium]